MSSSTRERNSVCIVLAHQIRAALRSKARRGSGRLSKRTDCTRRAIFIEDVEHRVEDYYQRVQLTPARRKALTGMLHHAFDRLMPTEADELAQLTANRNRLEREQDRLMQARYADAIPLPILKREQDRIACDLDQVTRRLGVLASTVVDSVDGVLPPMPRWALSRL